MPRGFWANRFSALRNRGAASEDVGKEGSGVFGGGGR